MLITEISPISQSRYSVRTDTKEEFVLYKSELKKYGIREGIELSNSVYLEIEEKVLKIRARKRAMNLLERSDRTERELTEKLEKDGYPASCVENAVLYVKKFGYLDDDRYIEVFIRSKSGRKSRKEIEYLLMQKGFSRDEIEAKMEDMDSETNDQIAIEKLLRKKNYDPTSDDAKKREKFIQYLMRKGFRYRDIRHVIQISNDDA